MVFDVLLENCHADERRVRAERQRVRPLSDEVLHRRRRIQRRHVPRAADHHFRQAAAALVVPVQPIPTPIICGLRQNAIGAFPHMQR